MTLRGWFRELFRIRCHHLRVEKLNGRFFCVDCDRCVGHTYSDAQWRANAATVADRILAERRGRNS